tara:strand:+ start:944 stop:2077 length:1134 start_codon:yes stop_codon:yes gene_type:complete
MSQVNQCISVFFFVNALGPPQAADYQHCIIGFAEGLKALGIHFDANINYYYYDISTKKSNNISNKNSINNIHYLFTEKHIETIEEYEKYDYLVTGYTAGIPDNILNKENRTYKTIMLDWSDGFNTHLRHQYNKYDYYFITSYNIHFHNQPKIFPLAFGLTNRLIETIQSLYKQKLELLENSGEQNNPLQNEQIQRKHTILYSHRLHHYMRMCMFRIYQQYPDLVYFYNDHFSQPSFNTIEYLHWHQSGRRHNIQFYQTLLHSKICDCTGGYLFMNVDKKYVYQVDSFKLWEAFMAGCCVITIDFDRYGIQLPVNPVNGVHYIGITDDSNEIKRLLKAIENNEINVEEIAKAGRTWALEHYQPKSIASYIVNIVTEEQ